jgi:hypothetical protein
VLVLIIAIGLIGVSPFGLGLFTGETGHWERLSFIGQTYGAASALLAVLALIGIAASLVFQARESRASREQAFRAANTEMLKMAMDDPDYAECWGGLITETDRRDQRRSMYVNMILTQWEMGFETGAIGEAHIRALAAGLFAGRVPWEFWKDARDLRITTAESRRGRRFQQIVDEEFRRLPAPRIPPRPRDAVHPPVAPARSHPMGARGRTALWTALGAAAGAVAAVAARHVTGRR